MYKQLNVSNYFKKTSNGKALCKFCNSTFACLSGNSNIKMHLFMSHPDQLGLTKISPIKKQQGANKSLIWTYYSKTGDDDRVASCNLCGKVLSYRSTTTNLKVHLSRSHNEEFVRYLENVPMHSDSSATEFVDTNNADDSDESDHISSEIWNYFEQETGGRVRCVVCRASRPNNVEDLKRHMEENHPKLLEAVGMTQDNAASDQGSVKDDDGAYTEVIYLEEDTKKSLAKSKYVYKTEETPKPVQRTSEVQQRVNALPDKKRRDSSSSDESPLRKSKESSELDTFMTYIKCLLKQLPKDTCAKLQMDIVNLIMNVKLNKTNDSSMDMSNISLKVPVISNYVTVTENVPSKMHSDPDSIRAETSDHSYMYTDINTKDQSRMIVDN